jgi:hypothetical protein
MCFKARPNKIPLELEARARYSVNDRSGLWTPESGTRVGSRLACPQPLRFVPSGFSAAAERRGIVHRLLRDAQADRWERLDFPIICESCLGDNPYVRMVTHKTLALPE